MTKIIKIILPQFLLTTLFFIVGSTLYWLLTIKLELITHDNVLICNILPGLISALLVFGILRSRIKLLKVTEKYRTFTLFLAFILMIVPLMDFQLYLHWTNSKHRIIHHPSELLTTKVSSYYTIEKSEQIKEMSGYNIHQCRAFREPEIRVNCYFVCPLVDIEENKSEHNIWIGLNLYDSFSDRVFDDETKQEILISNFIDSCMNLYNSHKFSTKFLKNLRTTSERKQYLKAIKHSRVNCNEEDLIILQEVENDYLVKANQALNRTKIAFTASILLWILLTIFPKMKTPYNTLV